MDLSDYRSAGAVSRLAQELARLVDRPMRFMEVCGTHTMAVSRHGLKALFPHDLELVSGPGCPVCVTSSGDMDAMVRLAGIPGITVATFGDLVRVPGSLGSLAEAKARGASVEVVYSPFDALGLARRPNTGPVVFLAVGFETTAPGVAATLLEASRWGTPNLSFYPAQKLMPPALSALLGGGRGDGHPGGPSLDGLLCPGHVSSITGAGAYAPIADSFGIPCVVGGFEPADVLLALVMLARQVREGRHDVENAYPRAVTWDGNARARAVMAEVFEPAEVEWRGLGVIPASGLALRGGFREYDARRLFGIGTENVPEPTGCLCGEVLTGRRTPADCPLFGRRCTPSSPVGPCMVSSEGSCAARYRFGV